jgi:hypothetical protein
VARHIVCWQQNANAPTFGGSGFRGCWLPHLSFDAGLLCLWACHMLRGRPLSLLTQASEVGEGGGGSVQALHS